MFKLQFKSLAFQAIPKMSRYDKREYRSLLPKAHVYYKHEFNRLKPGAKWQMLCCPFHADKHPSFSINLETGAFKCFSCGAKGANVLAYQMQRYGQSFKQALTVLTRCV